MIVDVLRVTKNPKIKIFHVEWGFSFAEALKIIRENTEKIEKAG